MRVSPNSSTVRGYMYPRQAMAMPRKSGPQMSPAAKFAKVVRHPLVSIVLISLLPVGLWTAFLAGIDISFIFGTSAFDIAVDSGFSHPITRLDTIYVTMGTLTSGTGDLVATSESVRAIEMVQELLDLLFVLFAVGVVVSRIVSRADYGSVISSL